MSIIACLVLSMIAGLIGSKIVNRSGQGLVFDILLGIVGAVVGGALFSLVGAAPVTGLELYSLPLPDGAAKSRTSRCRVRMEWSLPYRTPCPTTHRSYRTVR